MKKIDTNSNLYKIRHSLAHVLAQAVLEIRPDAKLGFGPPIDFGFYYDFDMTEPLSPEDLPLLEKRMRHIIKTGQVFEREELDQSQMVERLSKDKQSYKIEQVDDLSANNETLSLYRNGPFWDLCEGPHVESTRDIPKNCFALDSLAGAYWKGSEKNNMMQRVYGLAFETGEELKEYQEKRRLAMERDHRKLNSKLHYFTISEEVGKGLPLWLPNGTVIRDELEKLAKETEFLAGYKRVSTPHITKEDLYYTSGHLPYYEDSMFPPMEMDGERLFLKPMNCPHHHMIYKAEPRSYRDLPLRLAEYGTCYRYEQSGELAGLLRVRSMTMNDAHIYCSPEQAKAEFIKVMNLHTEYYKLFGLSDFWMRLSLAEEDAGKFVDEPELWEKAETLVTEAMDEVGIPYEAVRGEAAFYGPKIEFVLKDAINREWQCGTIQVDFNLPERLNANYINEKGEKQKPVLIHRAIFGSLERFLGILIEHYNGKFPFWLAPTQVTICTITEKFNNFGKEVYKKLTELGIKVEFDSRNEKINYKIREHSHKKVPIILIIGEKEKKENSVTVRELSIENQSFLELDKAIEYIKKKI